MTRFTCALALVAMALNACSGSSGDGVGLSDVVITFGEDSGEDLDLGSAEDGGEMGGLDAVQDAPADTPADSASEDAREDQADLSEDVSEDVADAAEVVEEVVECVPDCGTRLCGADPVCGESCGRCTEPGLSACNDGVCEATCNETACAANSWCEEFACEADCAGEDCTDEELCAETGIEVRNCIVFSCSDDGETCDSEDTVETGDTCALATEDDELSERTTGACSADDVCAVLGSQDLLATICQSGMPSSGPQVVGSQDCALTPDTSTPISTGDKTCDWSDTCDEAASGTRSATCCDGSGGTTSCDYAESCSRSRPVSHEFSRSCGSCHYPDSECSEEHMQDCTVVYCDGDSGTQSPVDETVRGTCTATRDTDGHVVSTNSSGCVDNAPADACNVDGTETTSAVVCSGGGRGDSSASAPCAATYDTSHLGPTRASGTCTATTGGCSYDGSRPQQGEYCDGSGGTEWRTIDGTISCSLNGTVNDPDGDQCIYAPRIFGACAGEQCCRSGQTANVYASSDLYQGGTFTIETLEMVFTPVGGAVDGKALVTITEGLSGVLSMIRFDALPEGAEVTSAALCLTPENAPNADRIVEVWASSCNKWGIRDGAFFDCELSFSARGRALATFKFAAGSTITVCEDFTTNLSSIAGASANGVVLRGAVNLPIYDEDRGGVEVGPRLRITYDQCR